MRKSNLAREHASPLTIYERKQHEKGKSMPRQPHTQKHSPEARKKAQCQFSMPPPSIQQQAQRA